MYLLWIKRKKDGANDILVHIKNLGVKLIKPYTQNTKNIFILLELRFN